MNVDILRICNAFISVIGVAFVIVGFYATRVVSEKNNPSKFNSSILNAIVIKINCEDNPYSSLSKGQFVFLSGCAVGDQVKEDINYVKVDRLGLYYPFKEHVYTARHANDIRAIAYSFNERMYTYDLLKRKIRNNIGSMLSGWYPDVVKRPKNEVNSEYKNPPIPYPWNPARFVSSDSEKFLFVGSIPVSRVFGEALLKFSSVGMRPVSWTPDFEMHPYLEIGFRPSSTATESKVSIPGTFKIPDTSLNRRTITEENILQADDETLVADLVCSKSSQVVLVTDEAFCPTDPEFLWVESEDLRGELLRSYARLYASLVVEIFRNDYKPVKDWAYTPDDYQLTEFLDLKHRAIAEVCEKQKAKRKFGSDDDTKDDSHLKSAASIVSCTWPVPNYRAVGSLLLSSKNGASNSNEPEQMVQPSLSLQYVTAGDAKNKEMEPQTLYDPRTSCILRLMERDHYSWQSRFAKLKTFIEDAKEKNPEVKSRFSRLLMSTYPAEYSYGMAATNPFCVGDTASLATLFVPTGMKEKKNTKFSSNEFTNFNLFSEQKSSKKNEETEEVSEPSFVDEVGVQGSSESVRPRLLVSLLGIWDGSKVVAFEESEVTISSLKTSGAIKSRLLSGLWITEGVADLDELVTVALGGVDASQPLTHVGNDYESQYNVQLDDESEEGRNRKRLEILFYNLKSIHSPSTAEAASYFVLLFGLILMFWPYLNAFSISRRLMFKRWRLPINGGLLILLGLLTSSVLLFFCAKCISFKSKFYFISSVKEEESLFNSVTSHAVYSFSSLLVLLSLLPIFVVIFFTANQIERIPAAENEEQSTVPGESTTVLVEKKKKEKQGIQQHYIHMREKLHIINDALREFAGWFHEEVIRSFKVKIIEKCTKSKRHGQAH